MLGLRPHFGKEFVVSDVSENRIHLTGILVKYVRPNCGELAGIMLY